MKTAADLRELLGRIDHKGYPAYKDTAGLYQFQGYVLSIDHVQGDPFAAPSDVSVKVKGEKAGFPAEYYKEDYCRIALQDMINRRFSKTAEKFSFQAKGSGKSGLLLVSRPGQEILERSSCRILPEGDIVFRLKVGFPANGRTINARELIKILFTFLPECVEQSLLYRAYRKEEVLKVVHLAEDQNHIRTLLEEKGLAAFVANGAILPRESGISQRPMKEGKAFVSPKSLEVELTLPHAGKMKGMGIKRGITLIAGGGYHGKSTLLKALEMGVYNHIAGDGREYVISDDTAMKLRAEDGRSIQGVDISMFIKDLPNGKDTLSFSTEDASGSTSQAANMVEAMESGSRVFFIDEDTSATNFMIRDELMQRVIHRDSEPITPFIDRVRELYDKFGISTILVAGSCGSYFHKADCIIQMKQYQPLDITEAAKREAENFPLAQEAVEEAKSPNHNRRVKTRQKLSDRVKVKSMGMEGVSIDKEYIDLRYVEQLCDSEQVNTLGYVMKYAITQMMDGRHTLSEMAEFICRKITEKGLGEIYGGRYVPAGLAVPRKQEIAACLNRYRKLLIAGK